eukprot:COSAG01_NODE_129_length_24935_cov_39.324368_1_plen_93_part_00
MVDNQVFACSVNCALCAASWRTCARARAEASVGVRDLPMLPSRPWGWEAHLPLYHALILEYLGDGGVDRGDEGIGHLGYRAEHLPTAAGILS